jgi:hypothetical protein
MARRVRFTPEEKTSFTPGTAVEWCDVSTWKTGVIVSGPVKADDDYTGRGYRWTVGVRTDVKAGIIPAGEVVAVEPGKIRLAPEADPAGDALAAAIDATPGVRRVV